LGRWLNEEYGLPVEPSEDEPLHDLQDVQEQVE
jgi:endogenous inhibitor of DNA gyrase (YacG/DUF329 family)